MTENTIPFRGGKEDGGVNELIDALDFPELVRRVQIFGRENPVALGFAALTVGLAAGMLMRNRTLPSSPSASSESSDLH